MTLGIFMHSGLQACLSGVLAILVLAAAANGRDNRRKDPDSQPSVFRASSNLVLVNASVLDQTGRPVNGLKSASFHVLESGVEQKILSFNQGDMPLSIVLVIDTSRSMQKLIGRRAEALYYLLKTSNPEDEYSVVEFGDRPWLALGWTKDTTQVSDCLNRAEAQGNTALLDAVVFAGGIARRAANARRILIVISDGVDNHSRRSVAGVRKYLLEANVEVYALDLMHDNSRWSTPWDADGPELLETVCEAGGGRRLEVERYTNLPKATEDIAREIRNQYILGYKPSALGRDGKYHRVELKVSRPPGFSRILVSWRHGYYEPRD
jgi:Ca-activated chloride channel family protein